MRSARSTQGQNARQCCTAVLHLLHHQHCMQLAPNGSSTHAAAPGCATAMRTAAHLTQHRAATVAAPRQRPWRGPVMCAGGPVRRLQAWWDWQMHASTKAWRCTLVSNRANAAQSSCHACCHAMVGCRVYSCRCHRQLQTRLMAPSNIKHHRAARMACRAAPP